MLARLKRGMHGLLDRVGLDVCLRHRLLTALRVERETKERLSYRWLSGCGAASVLDVGAHRGTFALWIHDLIPAARVYAFEPIADSFAALVAALGAVPGAQAQQIALGAADGTITIHRNAYSDSSSILPMAALHRAKFPYAADDSRRETVRVRCLDDVICELGAPGPYLVKIDTQGYEKNVLLGATKVLTQTSVAIIETSFFELYEGQPLFEEILSLMSAAGFFYAGGLYHLVDPDTGMFMQQDSVFLRQSQRREGVLGLAAHGNAYTKC